MNTFIRRKKMIIITNILRVNYGAYLCGDYNIDFLQIDNSVKINSFYRNLTMSDFSSKKYTLPTKLFETVCTFIDNVITNNIKCNHISGENNLINKYIFA